MNMFRQGFFGSLDPFATQGYPLKPRIPQMPMLPQGDPSFPTGIRTMQGGMPGQMPGVGGGMPRGRGPVQPTNAIDPAGPSNIPPGNPYPNPTAPPQPPPPGVGAMQEGQYDWGRAGDGQQTALMAPGVQAWINQMLFGPGYNTGWRNNFTPDPNNLLASIEAASGQQYTPGPTAMASGPARGY